MSVYYYVEWVNFYFLHVTVLIMFVTQNCIECLSCPWYTRHTVMWTGTKWGVYDVTAKCRGGSRRGTMGALETTPTPTLEQTPVHWLPCHYCHYNIKSVLNTCIVQPYWSIKHFFGFYTMRGRCSSLWNCISHFYHHIHLLPALIS